MLSVLGAQVIRTDESGAIGVTEAAGGLTVSVSGRS
jgi:beta-lactamase superfamily II metal-dependent hydrolase